MAVEESDTPMQKMLSMKMHVLSRTQGSITFCKAFLLYTITLGLICVTNHKTFLRGIYATRVCIFCRQYEISLIYNHESISVSKPIIVHCPKLSKAKQKAVNSDPCHQHGELTQPTYGAYIFPYS